MTITDIAVRPVKAVKKLLPQRDLTGKTKRPGRADIQGLRTIAVLAVIADHALHWPSGGFVGVDIFFVISGFLITGLLLREYDRTGTISFVDFYKRRIKRILPAATLVILTTLAASYFIFSAARLTTTAIDAAWASLFSANWRFASVGTDYFQSGGPVSPLQHYWSLAVEEQFYFVWPVVMLGILWLLSQGSAGRHGRVAVGAAIAILSAASFAWAMFETASNPTLAYFSTLSRTWELGIGALLAIIAPILTQLPTLLRPMLAWVGLAGIAASLFVINSGSTFPAPAAALPVFATALVIASGTGGTVKRLFPLTNPVSQYVGDISYSLYLWHFPVLILAAQVFDLTNGWTMTLVLVTIVLLTVYSYHLVEDRIRKSSWLDRAARKKSNGPVFSAAYKLTALSLLVVVTASVVVPQLIPRPAAPVATRTLTAPTPTASPSTPTLPPQLAKLQTEIAAATRATEWPALTPTMDDAIAGSQTPSDVTPCGQLGGLVNQVDCTWGDPKAAKTAIMVGDSTSMAYVSTVRAVLGENKGWRVMSYGTFGCTFFDLPGQDEAGSCADRKADAVATINSLKPDIVFVTNHYDERTIDGQAQPLPQDQVTSAVGSLVSQFKASAKKVVFLAPPPTDKNPGSCYNKISSPQDCLGGVTSRWLGSADAEKALARSMGATFVDSMQWFCADGQCPSFVGSTPVKRDRPHATPAYQLKIVPVVEEQLRLQKVL